MPKNLEALMGLRAGLERYMAGDYPNPRQHRPGNCEHNVPYYECCENCNDAYIQSLLDAFKPGPAPGVEVAWATPENRDG